MEHKYLDRDWLYDEYIVKGRTIKSIFEEFGVAHQSVEKCLKKFNIKKRLPPPEVPDGDKVRELYLDYEYGVNKIASMYPGVGVATIRRILSENNIKEFSRSDILLRWWAKPENKIAMSKKRLALWENEEYRAKTSVHLKDKKAISDRAVKHSANYQGVTVEEWRGFLTPEKNRIRNSFEYTEWRKRVFERDNYTCQCCGARSSAGHPVTLNAHHLENFASNEDLRFDVNNGITLCYKCHDVRADGSFHHLYGSRNNTRQQFDEYIENVRKKNIDKTDGGFKTSTQTSLNDLGKR